MFEKFRRPQLTDEEKLIKAGVLSRNTDTEARDLAVRGFRATGGTIPPSVLDTYELGHPLSDALRTDEGRATLAKLREQRVDLQGPDHTSAG